MGALVVASTLVGSTAAARSIPAFSGRAAIGGNESCLSVDPGNGWVTNACGFPFSYMVGLSADSNGSKTVDMTVKAPDTNQTMCREVAISRTGTNITASNLIHPSVAGAPVSILLTGASQITKGLLFVDCQIGPSASLIQIDYNN